MTPFPGKNFPTPVQPGSIVPQSPRVNDLINSVHKLPEYGDQILFHNNQIIPGDYYTEQIVPGEKSKTHFQSILRIPDSNYCLISGTDVRNEYSQLFIAKAGSYIDPTEVDTGEVNKVKKGPMGSNVVISDSPPITDFFVDVYKFKERGYYHAGGMDMAGSIIVVPIENKEGASIIKFLNVHDPEYPHIFPDDVAIVRDQTIGRAGATALCRLPSGKYLCGVWSDSDHRAARLDLYLSVSENILDGFETTGNYLSKTIYWSNILNKPDEHIKFQNIQFFLDDQDKIFILATDNPSVSTPVVGGVNRIHILQLGGDLNLDNSAFLASIRIGYLQSKNLCRLRYAFNFRAGANFYINHLAQLSLYAVAHWRTADKAKISIGEFYRPIEDDNQIITHIDHAVIELYEDKDFGIKIRPGQLPNQRKRCLKIYGRKNSDILNFEQIRVQDRKNFSKKASSIKYILPDGWRIKMYGAAGHAGTLIILQGNGKYQEIRNFKDIDFGDKLKSIKIDEGVL